MNKKNLNSVYLSDWYYSKVKYPLSDKGTYYDETENSFVYLMMNRSTSLYKIGITTSLRNRYRQIKLQSGCEIEVVLALQLHTEYDEPAKLIESMLHDFFSTKRTFGEWFKLGIRDLIAIRTLFYAIEGEDMKDNLKEHYKTHREMLKPYQTAINN
jgi:hypothetical protein